MEFTKGSDMQRLIVPDIEKGTPIFYLFHVFYCGSTFLEWKWKVSALPFKGAPLDRNAIHMFLLQISPLPHRNPL